MIRILLNIITGLSLLLCVASAVAWVRSYRATIDTVILDRASRAPGVLTNSQHAALWSRGTLRFSMSSTTDTCDRAEILDRIQAARRQPSVEYKFVQNPVEWFERSTIAKGRQRFGPLTTGRIRSDTFYDAKGMRATPQAAIHHRAYVKEEFDVRLWLVVLLFAATPSVRAVRFVQRVLRRRGRGRAGLCPTCGYDCRSTPERHTVQCTTREARRAACCELFEKRGRGAKPLHSTA